MNTYNYEVAKHYAAYRPDLHQSILRAALGNSKFDWGLDIGCGTGQSSIALSNHCQRVIGLEPSNAMRRLAISNPQVTYQHFSGSLETHESNKYDIISFAGSLSYGKSQELINEIHRISAHRAQIFVYDFVVDLDQIFREIFDLTPAESSYDFRLNFNGLSHDFFEEMSNSYKQSFEVVTRELKHLFLADFRYRNELLKSISQSDIQAEVRRKLNDTQERLQISADIYFILYSKSPE